MSDWSTLLPAYCCFSVLNLLTLYCNFTLYISLTIFTARRYDSAVCYEKCNSVRSAVWLLTGREPLRHRLSPAPSTFHCDDVSDDVVARRRGRRGVTRLHMQAGPEQNARHQTISDTVARVVIPTGFPTIRYDTIRCDTIRYINVRSKADEMASLI